MVDVIIEFGRLDVFRDDCYIEASYRGYLGNYAEVAYVPAYDDNAFALGARFLKIFDASHVDHTLQVCGFQVRPAHEIIVVLEDVTNDSAGHDAAHPLGGSGQDVAPIVHDRAPHRRSQVEDHAA